MHKPVLFNEVKSFCQWEYQPKTYLDCTFGRGGHAKEILKLYPHLKCNFIDRDSEAIAYGKENFQDYEVQFYQKNFMSLAEDSSWLAFESYDLILADLGVSSPQLDQAGRGFSFYHDGPLDMRMDTEQDLTAADIVNHWPEEDLIEIFQKYAEIRNPQRIVKALLEMRSEKEFSRTIELADFFEKLLGWRKKGSHPATKFFLALRMEVNQEIAPLENAIQKCIDLLADQARLLVITFHSIEDRIVKWTMREQKHKGTILTKKVIQPSRDEEKENPRARSAKLRVFQKGVYDERKKY